MLAMKKKHSKTVSSRHSSLKSGKTNMPELFQAYKQTNAMADAFKRFTDLSKDFKGSKNDFSEDPEERALQRWKWAFEIVKQRMKDEQDSLCKKAGLQSFPTIEGVAQLDESFDSDLYGDSDEDSLPVQEMSPSKMDLSSRIISKQTSKLPAQGMQRLNSRFQMKRQFSLQNDTIQMNFKRHTMKEKQISQISRRKPGMSIYDHRRATD